MTRPPVDVGVHLNDLDQARIVLSTTARIRPPPMSDQSYVHGAAHVPRLCARLPRERPRKDQPQSFSPYPRSRILRARISSAICESHRPINRDVS